MHALRLFAQGVELRVTGRITLPVPDPAGTYLRAVRRGQVPLAQVVAALDDVEAELVRLQTQADVPPEPDRQWVDAWLHRSHLSYWSTLDQAAQKSL